MKPIASRALQIQPSITVAIDTKAKEMLKSGVDLVVLGAGEPDFDTPQAISNAGIQSIQQGKTRYTHPTGLQELKEAVCAKFLHENSLQYDPQQIVISSGAKHSVFNALMALIEPGDEVLIPTPSWVTYPELVRLLGGTAVLIPTDFDNNYLVSAKQIQSAITPRTKMLILNSPSNPSGSVYSKQALQEIADVLVQSDLYCLSDEIYEHISYDTPHISIASLGSEIFQRTIVINGVSKAYAMTGWRIGYLGANSQIASAIAKLQSQSTHHPANASQWAAIEALQGSQEPLLQMQQEFKNRRNWIVQQLQQIQGIRLKSPAGAFYVFPDVSSFYGSTTPAGQVIQNSVELCTWLLESHGLAIVPGAAFGTDSCVRLSYAASQQTLERAIERLKRGLSELRI